MLGVGVIVKRNTVAHVYTWLAVVVHVCLVVRNRLRISSSAGKSLQVATKMCSREFSTRLVALCEYYS